MDAVTEPEPEVEAIVTLHSTDSNVQIVVTYDAQDVRNIIENAAVQECVGAIEGMARHLHQTTVVLRPATKPRPKDRGAK
jgi:hypothetical protein